MSETARRIVVGITLAFIALKVVQELGLFGYSSEAKDNSHSGAKSGGVFSGLIPKMSGFDTRSMNYLFEANNPLPEYISDDIVTIQFCSS